MLVFHIALARSLIENNKHAPSLGVSEKTHKELSNSFMYSCKGQPYFSFYSFVKPITQDKTKYVMLY